MKASFTRRLERLEAAAAMRCERPGISPPQRLLLMILAFHRGGWQPHEALAAGWGRAFGYARTAELLTDLKTRPGEVARRHNEVLGEFLAEHGLRLDVSTWEEAFPTVADLFEQIPEALRLRFGLPSALDAFGEP